MTYDVICMQKWPMISMVRDYDVIFDEKNTYDIIGRTYDINVLVYDIDSKTYDVDEKL